MIQIAVGLFAIFGALTAAAVLIEVLRTGLRPKPTKEPTVSLPPDIPEPTARAIEGILGLHDAVDRMLAEAPEVREHMVAVRSAFDRDMAMLRDAGLTDTQRGAVAAYWMIDNDMLKTLGLDEGGRFGIAMWLLSR